MTLSHILSVTPEINTFWVRPALVTAAFVTSKDAPLDNNEIKCKEGTKLGGKDPADFNYHRAH
jgi:hypothetical protein